MVDLTLLQSVSYIAGALGVSVAAVYYVFTLRINMRTQQLALKSQELALKSQEQTLETRQAQLFMQLYTIYESKEFLRDYTDVCWRLEYKDWDDLLQKYNPQKNPEAYASIMRLGRFFEGVGILVEKKLININIVVELMSEAIIFSWQRLKVYAEGQRQLTKMPHIWSHFEHLAEEIISRQPKAGSAETILDTVKKANV